MRSAEANSATFFAIALASTMCYHTDLAGCLAASGQETVVTQQPVAADANATQIGTASKQISVDSLRTVPVKNALLKTIESTRVAAEVAGKIEQLAVDIGSDVSLQQPLVEINSNGLRLQVERAKIALTTARKKKRSDIDMQLAEHKAAVAQNELERAVSANERLENTYSPKEVDRLELIAASTQLEIQRAKYEQEILELDAMLAENDVQQAEDLLAKHQVRAPARGVVVTVNRRVGEWVEPGTELLQIVTIDRLRVEGFVDGGLASPELKGCPAQVRIVSGERTFDVQGTVVFVSPEVDSIDGGVRVYLEIDNRNGKFLPGMRVEASIHANANDPSGDDPSAKGPSAEGPSAEGPSEEPQEGVTNEEKTDRHEFRGIAATASPASQR